MIPQTIYGPGIRVGIESDPCVEHLQSLQQMHHERVENVVRVYEGLLGTFSPETRHRRNPKPQVVLDDGGDE